MSVMTNDISLRTPTPEEFPRFIAPLSLAFGERMSLDISDLAAVYLGAFRFADLARADRVMECRPGALAAADGLFATLAAPSNVTMF